MRDHVQVTLINVAVFWGTCKERDLNSRDEMQMFEKEETQGSERAVWWVNRNMNIISLFRIQAHSAA